MQIMTDREIKQYISSGADFYVSLFGEAVHMQKVDTEFYSYVKPKEGEHGISFIYRVHIEDLPTEQKKMVIDEMKAMQMPIWLDLLISAETASLFSGKEGKHDQTEYDEDGESYLALLLEEKENIRKGTMKSFRYVQPKSLRCGHVLQMMFWQEENQTCILCTIIICVKKD